MNYKHQAGLNKKSFELYFNGGSIWAEHLDSMGGYETEVIQKFLNDYKAFSLPSVSSFIIINLDETVITDTIVNCIVGKLTESNKVFMKIAFVGVNRKYRSQFSQIQKAKKTAICFFSDYEKAKKWLLP